MKTLICNCCLSGFLYQKANKIFDNPFFWCRIIAADFTKLLVNYENINYENISICTNKDLVKIDPYSCQPTTTSIILNDFNIRVQFNHYKYSKSDKIPRKEKISDFVWDIFYYKNYEYTYNKFIERSNRLDKNNKDVLFVFCDNEMKGYSTLEEKIELLEAANKNKKKLIFITKNKFFKNYETDFVEVIIDEVNFEKIVDIYYDKFI